VTYSRFSLRAGKSVLILLSLMTLLALVSFGGDDDEENFDENEPVASASTQNPTVPTSNPAQPASPAPNPATTPAPSVASSGSSTIFNLFRALTTANRDLPRLPTQVDLLFNDLNTGKLVFEVEAESQFGESPKDEPMFPASGQVLRQTMSLAPFSDFTVWVKLPIWQVPTR